MFSKKLIMKLGIGLLSIIAVTLGINTGALASLPVFSSAEKLVHYNWGQGSPGLGFPSDYFEGLFDQSGTYAEGDYFVQTFADDGVKLEADGKWLINRWSGYTAKVDRALWLNVENAHHTVKTHYYEGVGGAGVFSDIVPLGTWLAYYYSNPNVSGLPVSAKMIQPFGEFGKVSENFGAGSPAQGVPNDWFSAKYTTAKRIPAGEYILRAKANDGVRVYVDGKLVINRWTNSSYREDAAKVEIKNRSDAASGEQDIHWIDVEYYEATDAGQVEFFIEPASKAAANTWLGEYYPNMMLQGTPVVVGGANSMNMISSLNFNWGNAAPHGFIPADNFSARFTKKEYFDEGTYVFEAKADDGMRVWVDNELVFDVWQGWISGYYGTQLSKLVPITAGEHVIKVEYKEISSSANLTVNYRPIAKVPVQSRRDVHFNWGNGSPGNGIPADYFEGVFDQSGFYSMGDYFIQAFADDGVKVEADGNWLINRWSGYTARPDRALWLNVQAGQQTVKTHYYEGVGGAGIFSDIVPFGTWLGYYYANPNVSGMPTAAKVVSPEGEFGKLSENFGTGSPAPGVPADWFSAKYTTAKRIPAGEYILRAKANDGIRVYVDGKLVINRWTNSSYREDSVKIQIANHVNTFPSERDVHWIDVEYYEATDAGQIEFFLEPLEKANQDSWLGEYYPNRSLQGNAVIVGGTNSLNQLAKLNFNWGKAAPIDGIPADDFSARYTKKENFEAGMYLFEAKANDGVRVWLDNQLVFDMWQGWVGGYYGTQLSKLVSISEGEHTVTVEYNEMGDTANLDFNYRPITKMPQQSIRNVHYNWGNGSPESGIPTDYFQGIFDQSGYYQAGDYYVQTFADDGVKVQAGGNTLIDRFSGYTAKVERALWLDVSEGQQTVKTHYYEGVGGAGVFSDIVPFGTWLAYYYPTTNMTGLPTAAKVISPIGEFGKLSEDFGTGSPALGIPADWFSAKYTTAQRIPAGEYILRAKANDGIRVYVDGNLVINRWTNSSLREDSLKLQIQDRPDAKQGEKDIHWIEVEYYEATDAGQVEFLLEPFSKAIENEWIGEFYPNMSLEGKSTIVGGINSLNRIPALNYNWKSNSPDSTIPSDKFSGKFTKAETFDAGTYVFELKADDGARVYVDDQLVIDAWNNNDINETKKVGVYLTSGKHKIVVDYYENVGSASLTFDYNKISTNKVFYQNGGSVSYNWGTGGPVNFPVDNFESVFEQSMTLANGDYFVQAFADDGVKVEANGQVLIDRWRGYTAKEDRALWLNIPAGEKKILTRHYEGVGEAGVFSNIVPLGSWLAYYYPNHTLTGLPTASKVIDGSGELGKLTENSGLNSPITGIPVDNFGARYTTAKRVSAGDYVLRASADDAYKVYIDGNLVLNGTPSGDFKEDAIKITIQDRSVQNSAEKDIHWIEVEYYEYTGSSNIEIALQPYADMLNTEQWIGYLYPNKNLTGEPVILGGVGSQRNLEALAFDWGTGKPTNQIPADGFSGRFIKKAYFSEGNYQLKTYSDDGIRVYVDGVLKINSWVDSGYDYLDAVVPLSAGQHEIIVEYYDSTGSAALKVELVNLSVQKAKFVSAIRLPAYRSFEELADYTKHLTFYNSSYTRLFELGYGDLITVLEERLYAARIKTSDGKEGWVHKAYLEDNVLDDLWLVKEARTLRSEASASSTNLGSVLAGAKVRVIDHVITSGSYTEWYYIQTESGKRGWIWGAITTSGNAGYNVIKYEFNKANTITNDITIFTPLNTKANVTADQINRFIEYKTQGKTSVMKGMGNAYLTAQELSGLNAIYLLAHSGLETGWGTSKISTSKYNFYGIGAIDSAPAEGAYDFTSPEGGIIAGASWIADNYVIRAKDTDDVLPFYQPTLDNMRYDNSWHQYASDEAWTVKIAYFAQEFYNFIN